MSTYVLWMLLSLLTGNPLLAAGLLLAFALLSGRYAFAAPPPLRVYRQWQRGNWLDRQLLDNPHNRSARFERAELYLARHQYARAVSVLRQNLERDQDDDTLFVMGAATYGAGDAELGEQLLSAITERAPLFRYGVAWLELGRFRLRHKDAQGARSALERYCQINESSVEGRVLLARALKLGGDNAGSHAAFNQAWQVYRSLPRFSRRRERLWAYRANPTRAAVVVSFVALLAFLVLVLPRI